MSSDNNVASLIARLSNAKADIQNAIQSKGVSVSTEDGFEDFASQIRNISSGGGSSSGLDTSDATASATDILLNKTAYVNGSKITGSIPSKAAATYNPSTSEQSIDAGQYLSGKQTIAAVTASNIPSTLKETKSATPSETQQTINATSGKVMTAVTVNAISNTYVGSSVPRQAAKIVTPTRASQTVVASGAYTTGVVTVGGIPEEYIIPSGSQTISANDTYDVTNLSQVIVDVASGATLPSGISKLDFGTIRITSAFTTTAQTFNHNLGVIPDLMIVWSPANIATTYSMLAAIRGGQFGWRSSSYTSHYAYHGNSTTTVTWANSNNANYGIGSMTATTFKLASLSTSYYWRAGTYNYIAIKF